MAAVLSLTVLVLLAFASPVHAQRGQPAYICDGPFTCERFQSALGLLQQRLDRLKRELADLQTKYSDRHPDVLDKKSEISLLEHQIAAAEGKPIQRPRVAYSAGMPMGTVLAGYDYHRPTSP